MKRVSYKFIAEELGINVKTIYRVMNHETTVKEITRLRVIEALNRYGYFFHDAGCREKIIFDVGGNPYLEYHAMSLLKRLPTGEMDICVTNHHQALKEFLKMTDTARTVVFFSAPETQVLNAVKEANPNILRINVFGYNGGDIIIAPDNIAGGRLAAEYLYQSGHRRLAVYSSSSIPGQFLRCRSFLMEAELNMPDVSVEKFIFSEHTDQLFKFFERGKLPQAVFATCGWYAYQLYNAAIMRGVKIPEDLSIIGYDGPNQLYGEQADIIDYICDSPECVLDWAEYYIRKRPLMKNGNTVSTLTGVHLEKRGSVKNINRSKKIK